VNGGDGTNQHPTQALGDLVCLLKAVDGQWKRLEGFRLGLFGDLTRSRVARSWSKLAPRVGIELSFLSPASWKPDWIGSLPWTDDKKAWLGGLDAVMALRVQKERMESKDGREMAEFANRYQLGLSDLGAKQWLLHPGPVNWGVELGAELRTDKRSLLYAQMESGLALRTRVLELCS
jgi:aspartate carbamoyltransferase catalytic subunit